MLSALKCATSLVLFFIATSSYAEIDLKALRNQVKSQHYNQSTIEAQKAKDPNYREDADWKSVQDQNAQNKFMNYGTSITGSCTAITKETTSELICNDRVEEITKTTQHTQTKDLVSIDWLETIIKETIIVYYCDINNSSYTDINDCSQVCNYMSCPSNYTLTNGQCYSAPQCDSGGSFNPTSNLCEATRNVSCPTGMTFDSSLERCTKAASCPNGGVLNGTTDLCEITIGTGNCPSGYTYDPTNKGCTRTPTCSAGTYNAATDRCEFAVTYTCPNGYSYNGSTGVCEAVPVCPSGTTYNAAQNKCLVSATLSCSTGYTLSSGSCISTPTCLTGTLNSTTDKCEASNGYSCSLGGTYTTNSQCTTACQSSTTPSNSIVQTISSYDSYNGCSGIKINSYSESQISLTHYVSTIDPQVCNKFVNTYNLTRGGASVCNTQSIGFSGTECYTYLSNGDLELHTSLCFGTFGCSDSTVIVASYSSKYTCPEGYALSADAVLCYKSGTCSQGGCPTGTTLSGALCVSSPTCSGGGIYNNATNRCEVTVTQNCPTGTSYDSALNMCVSTPTCTSGGLLNTATDKCTLTVTTSCPSGYTMSGNVCYSTPICPSGTYNATLNLCLLSASTLCPSGYSFNSTTDKCEQDPVCSPGSYSITINKCAEMPTITCAGGYTYNSSTKICEASPMCTENGVYESALKKCELGATTNYVACTAQEELVNKIEEVANLIYTENPYPLPAGCGTVVPYSCNASSMECVRKNAAGLCIKSENVCRSYSRPYTCTIIEKHIYKDCDYQASTSVVGP